MQKSRKLSILLVTLLMLIVGACTPTEQDAPIILENEFESNVFSLSYPEGWQYQIPQTNMMFLASPEILAQDAGATVTIQRSIALSNNATTTEEALNNFLERGPLSAGRNWEIVGEFDTIQVADYDALTVIVEGAERAETLPMRSQIYLLQADSTFYFVLTMTAPLDQWDDIAPTFDAILDSVDILE